MFYIVERVGEARRQDLFRDAQRVRQSHVFAGERSRVRRPLGRFLVRVGSHLSGERQQEPRLVTVGESG